MIDMIKEIPGQVFLFLYILFAFGIVLFGKRYAENDYTKDMEIPDPTLLDPLDMALLIKGVEGTIMVSIFNLWKKKIIDIKQDEKKIELIKLSSDVDGLNNVEKNILGRINSSVLYGEFFTQNVKRRMEDILEPNKQKLEWLKLLPDAEINARYSKALTVVFSFLLLFGGTKLILGITRGKPVFFLLVLIVGSIIVLFTSRVFDARYSALGKKFIAASSQRFEWIKNNKSDDLMADSNLLYGAALFGVGVFMGPSLGFLDQYSNASAGGCAGGCGGGGCGGGCGGCGGCGG